MKALLRNRGLQFTLRLTAGTVFIYAGTMKVRDPLAFEFHVAAYHLLPPHFNSAVAHGLPWLEIVCGALLVGGWRNRPAAFSMIVLDIVFITTISQAIARGLNVNCGCFGSAGETQPSLLMALGRDVVLMGALGLIYWNACLDTFAIYPETDKGPSIPE